MQKISACHLSLWTLTGLALIALSPDVLRAADGPGPDWATKLPPNIWTQIDEKQFGNRLRATVIWLPSDKKLYVTGGLFSITRREAKRPNSMLFDPASGAWSEYKGSPALPAPAPQLVLQDPTFKSQKYSVTLPEELKDIAGTRTPTNSPLSDQAYLRSLGFGHETVFLDPVNREVHLVGGSVTGVREGHVGNWIYSIEKNEWRRAAFGSEAGRALGKALKSYSAKQKDLVAKARNLFYSSLPTDKESDATKKTLAGPQATCAEQLTALAGKLSAEGKGAGIAEDSLAVAGSLLQKAMSGAKAAADALAAGTLDAKSIKQMEEAFWRCDEAADAIAFEPTPRRGASGAYDPARKQYVLFGGDHGDYLLNDTWAYDCATKKWLRKWPKTAPPARFGAQTFWLPETKQIAFLSGNRYPNRMIYQIFNQKVGPEVWVYDPAQNAWTFAVRPGEEVQKKSRDGAPIFMVNNPVVLVDGGVLLCPAVGGNQYHDYMISSTWMLRLDTRNVDASATEKYGVAGERRTYRSDNVAVYNPQWYDEAPRGNPDQIAQLIEKMPVNQWVEMPTAPRPCPERSWGTCVYDPDRDQIFVWSGGHCADPADIVHHYHPGLNRWSLPYVAGGGVFGNQLTGRPDCNNHTYHNFAFDTVSRKMIAVHRAGTHVYDPSVREWTAFTPKQLFNYNPYSSKCVATPHGVVAWAGGCSDGGPSGRFFQLFDADALTWTPLTVKGAVPANVHGDEGGLVWDPKREKLYIFAAAAYQKPDGRVRSYDFKSGAMTVLDPANRDTIGDKFHQYRETTYLPEADLVLFGMGFVNGKQVAYDPGKNRWVFLDIAKSAVGAKYDEKAGAWSFGKASGKNLVGTVTFSPVLDTKRNVLWAPSDYKAMYVMKLDAKTLKVSDAPPAKQ